MAGATYEGDVLILRSYGTSLVGGRRYGGGTGVLGDAGGSQERVERETSVVVPQQARGVGYTGGENGWEMSRTGFRTW